VGKNDEQEIEETPQTLEPYLEELLYLLKQNTPQNIKKTIEDAGDSLVSAVKGIKVEIPNDVTINNSQPLKIDLKELKEVIEKLIVEIGEELKENRVNEVSLKDPENIKIRPNFKINLNHLKEIRDLLEKLISKKQVNEIILPDKIDINWPTTANKAIPVVLVDKDRRNFYNASLSILGSGGVDRTVYAVRVQTDSGNSNIKYVGEAKPGSLTSAAVWRIRKVDKTVGTVITWANGSANAINIYDNRESLTYV